MTDSSGAEPDADPGRGRPLDLLVWDAPNIDMTLSNVIGGRPTPASRPRFDAVARWLLAGAVEDGQPVEVEGCVFANVPPGSATQMRGWIEAIRSFGYAVFARPKLGPEDDIDADMLVHIERRAADHRLRRLVHGLSHGRLRRYAARSGPSRFSRRSLERPSRWNTVLGRCSPCSHWGSPGSCGNRPGLRAQALTEAGALPEVGARTARLTHGAGEGTPAGGPRRVRHPLLLRRRS